MATEKDILVKDKQSGVEHLVNESHVKQLDKERFEILGEGKIVKESGINVYKLTSDAQEKADKKVESKKEAEPKAAAKPKVAAKATAPEPQKVAEPNSANSDQPNTNDNPDADKQPEQQ